MSWASSSPPPFGAGPVVAGPIAPLGIAWLEVGPQAARLHIQRAENFFDLQPLKTSRPWSLFVSSSECFTSLNSSTSEQILVSSTIHAAQYLYTAAERQINFAAVGKQISGISEEPKSRAAKFAKMRMRRWSCGSMFRCAANLGALEKSASAFEADRPVDCDANLISALRVRRKINRKMNCESKNLARSLQQLTI